MWHDSRPYGEFGGRSAVVQELDAESDGNRSEERSGFTKPTPGTRRSVLFTGVRRGVAVLHTDPSFSGDEGLAGAGIQESY